MDNTIDSGLRLVPSQKIVKRIWTVGPCQTYGYDNVSFPDSGPIIKKNSNKACQIEHEKNHFKLIGRFKGVWVANQ